MILQPFVQIALGQYKTFTTPLDEYWHDGKWISGADYNQTVDNLGNNLGKKGYSPSHDGFSGSFFESQAFQAKWLERWGTHEMLPNTTNPLHNTYKPGDDPMYDWGPVIFQLSKSAFRMAMSKLGPTIIESFASRNASSFISETGSIIWPPNDGFAGIVKSITLKPGTLIDRYGPSTGRFVSPKGTSFGARSLAPTTITTDYHLYEIVKPTHVKAGEVAKWFNQPGGGIQYKFNQSINELIKNGNIKELK